MWYNVVMNKTLRSLLIHALIVLIALGRYSVRASGSTSSIGKDVAVISAVAILILGELIFFTVSLLISDNKSYIKMVCAFFLIILIMVGLYVGINSRLL